MACTRMFAGLMVFVAVLGGREHVASSSIPPVSHWQSIAGSRPIAPPSISCPTTKPILAQPPKDPNANFGFGEWYVSSDRQIWVTPGPWRAGREGNKVIWIRPAGTELKIQGQRLGSPAPPLRVHMPCCYPTGFQVTDIIVPNPGCWEITAKAGSSELTFVTEVARNKRAVKRHSGKNASGVHQ